MALESSDHVKRAIRLSTRTNSGHKQLFTQSKEPRVEYTHIFFLAEFAMFSLLLLLGCQSDTKSDLTDTATINVFTCDMTLPVIDWSESGMPTEGIEGIEAELAYMDFSTLVDPVDISELVPMFRGIIAYALEISPSELPDQLSHSQALAAGKLGEVVLGSLLLGQTDGTGMDFTFFRRGFHRYYTCSREFPLTLNDFQAQYGTFTSDDGTIIDSIAKCGDRNLLSVGTNVYVAESLVDGVVRETEILLRNQRTDGQLEFLVYDATGHLTNRTQFPTINEGPHVVTAAPYACMTCHLNPDSAPAAWGYDILMPETGPCM